VKRTELVRTLLQNGCVLHRHGSRHDIYLNPATGKKQSVPRHNEVDEALTKHIIKHLARIEKK
jgi:predicted RNA binding protein YcfA (HicA-like mRNA interferase family)